MTAVKGKAMRAMIVMLGLMVAAPAFAQAALKPPLQPLSFLVGEWRSDDGKVADTGGTSKGGSHIGVASDGWALLREDQTQLFDKEGKPAGSFHQTMMIYPDRSGIRADYVDGEGHAIHYVSADVTEGKSVTFASAPGQGPQFRLRYEMQGADAMTVSFGMIPPGQTDFHAIAVGTLKKVH